MSPIIGSRGFGRWVVSSIGGGGGPWWYATISYVGSSYNYNSNNHALASDSLGNIYASRGGQNTSYYQSQSVLSISNAGSLNWQRMTSGSGEGVTGFKSDTLGVTGYGYDYASMGQSITTSGTSAFGNYLGNNGYSGGSGLGSYPAKPGYLLHKGQSPYSSDSYEVVAFMNGNTKLWTKTLSQYDGGQFPYDGLYYANNQTYYWQNGRCAIIDDSGNYLYARNINISSSKTIGVDTSGNVYGGQHGNINKFSSTLIPIWGLQYTPASTGYGGGTMNATLVDASNNVYQVITSNSNFLQVIKIDSGGTVQWVRRLTNSTISSGQYRWAFTLSKNDDLVFYMFPYSYPWLGTSYIIKLPNDGTKTGSYYPWTWATDTSLTITSYSPSQSNYSYAYNGGIQNLGGYSSFYSDSNMSFSKSGDIS